MSAERTDEVPVSQVFLWSRAATRALARPSVSTYQKLANSAETKEFGYAWVIGTGFMTFFFSAPLTAMTESGDSHPLDGTLHALGAALSIVGYLVVIASTYYLARRLGGGGSQEQLSAAIAAFYSPILLLGGLIPASNGLPSPFSAAVGLAATAALSLVIGRLTLLALEAVCGLRGARAVAAAAPVLLLQTALVAAAAMIAIPEVMVYAR